MKRMIATVALLTAAVLACGEDPVELIEEPRLMLTADSLLVELNMTGTVSAVVMHSEAQAQFVSRDPSIASVDEAGVVTGHTLGSTYIVAALADRADIVDSLRVRVQPAPVLTFIEDSTTLEIGASTTMATTVLYSSAFPQFTSRTTAVATVNSQGRISGAGTGSTWVVASLVGRPEIRDSILVRVPMERGAWGYRSQMLQNNSEFAFAAANGKLYVMGGYPPSRVTSRAVQVYDIATDTWTLGPQLPQPNNHGMAASVNGRIYLIGGQVTDDQEGASAVNTVYELDPAVGEWVARATMPTARSGGVAVASGGKIYVAGGRVPRGNDFAVYDPATNTWEVLPNLPSQRNHVAGVAIDGRIHIVGGRLGNGLSPLKSDAHEVYDPVQRTWTTAAPMLRGRSGMNSAVAHGCFHVWGGEAPTGMTPDHDYYDPRTNRWTSLPFMPVPVHGVVGSAFVDGVVWVTGGGTQIGGASGSLFNQTYQPAVSCE